MVEISSLKWESLNCVVQKVSCTPLSRVQGTLYVCDKCGLLHWGEKDGKTGDETEGRARQELFTWLPISPGQIRGFKVQREEFKLDSNEDFLGRRDLVISTVF